MAALLIVLAAGVGILLGLLGGGGSILSVPLLTYFGGLAPKQAIAGSLLVVGVTSATAATFHARAGRVRWKTAAIFGATAMPGAFLGGKLSSHIPGSLLLLAFAGVMIAAAIAMFRRREQPAQEPELPVSWVRVLVQGFGVGVLAGLLGAGGGFLIVPALVLLHVPMAEAVGTSLVVISLQSFAGYAGHAADVQLPWLLIAAVTAVAVLGSLLGHRFVGRIPAQTLRKGFAVFVLGTAVAMILGEIPKV